MTKAAATLAPVAPPDGNSPNAGNTVADAPPHMHAPPQRKRSPWRLPVSKAPPHQPMAGVLKAGLSSSLAILILVLFGDSIDLLLLSGSFGASCVLIFGFPESPLSQPRAVIGGHVVGTFTGLLILQFMGLSPYSIALAAGLAFVLMQATRTTHPPAGADALIVILGAKSWGFLVTPILLGSVMLVLLACLIHRVNRTAAYPRYWY